MNKRNEDSLDIVIASVFKKIFWIRNKATFKRRSCPEVQSAPTSVTEKKNQKYKLKKKLYLIFFFLQVLKYSIENIIVF